MRGRSMRFCSGSRNSRSRAGLPAKRRYVQKPSAEACRRGNVGRGPVRRNPVAFNRTFAAIGESGFLVGVLDLGPITRKGPTGRSCAPPASRYPMSPARGARSSRCVASGPRHCPSRAASVRARRAWPPRSSRRPRSALHLLVDCELSRDGWRKQRTNSQHQRGRRSG